MTSKRALAVIMGLIVVLVILAGVVAACTPI